MKDSTQFYLWLGALVFLTAFEWLWLWFILKRPAKWAAFVDLENDFWVRKGIASASWANWMKRTEKGMPLKIAVGGVAFLSTVGLAFIGYLLLKHGLPK